MLLAVDAAALLIQPYLGLGALLGREDAAVDTVSNDRGMNGLLLMAEMSVDGTARRTHIAAAQLRRLKRAAKARANGRPDLERRSGLPDGALPPVRVRGGRQLPGRL